LVAKETNLETFWEQFERIEARTKALTRRFGTLQLYAILRTRIFYAIAGELGLFDNPHPHFAKEDLPDGTPQITSLDVVTRVDAVIVPFRRRVAGNEPYSDKIRDGLLAAGKRVRTIDFRSNKIEKPCDDDEGEAGELDIERLKDFFAKSESKTVARIMRFTSRRPQVNAWQKLIAVFESEFGVTLEKFNRYPQWLVRRTLAEQRGFAELFLKLGAKDLYIANAYSEPSIVLGAHRAGLRVHEIQHGFISKFHPAYSFGAKRAPKLNSAPDTILTWGSYWGEGVSLAKGTKLRVTGPTKAFRDYRELAIAENRVIANQVLFTSQGAIATELFKAALETARLLPDHEVIYRLHPNEALADFEALLANTEKPKNLVLSHRDPVFLDLVSQSEYLIGAFSTTIFEGLALGCKALVLPLAGFENMKPAIDAGDITLIGDLDNLASTLANARRAEHPEKYYSKEDHARFV
jgi:hypothetical protein